MDTAMCLKKQVFYNAVYNCSTGRLGNWVNEMRSQYRGGRLKPDRKRKLEEIGFKWNTKSRESTTPFVKGCFQYLTCNEIASWQQYYEDLKQFRDTHGHCNVRRKDGK